MHWGHAVSDDLVTWEHKGIALYPTKKMTGADAFRVVRSSLTGNAHFYTGINYREEDPENINCALNYGFIASQMKIVSQDGYTFDNFNAKTTIIQPLRDSTSGSESDTRDPKVWRGSDAWYMIVGSTYDNNGRFLFFKSENLENWEYVNYCEKEDSAVSGNARIILKSTVKA